MSKDVSFKNRGRFIQMGITISNLRKARGLSQKTLAEKAGLSYSLIESIENPNIAKNFSLQIVFNIADALNVNPAVLMNTTVDKVI